MRCAHRNGLLMSAPELATELRASCGPIDQWRDDEDDEDFGYVKRAGTEVYDAAGDGDEEDDDLNIGGPLSIHSIAAKMNTPKSTSGPPRPKTEIDRFAGMEMTSLINMIDLEHQGAKPLVDLNVAPPLNLDSGPRSLASGPNALPSGPQMAPPNRPLPTPFGSADGGLGGATVLGIGQAGSSSGPPPRGAPQPPNQRTSGGRPAQPMQPQPMTRAFTPEPLSLADRLPAPRRDSRPQVAGWNQPRSSTLGGRSGLKTWIVVVAILLVAGLVAIIVAMSGPNVPGK